MSSRPRPSATLVMAAIALLLIMEPLEVLLPYLVKNSLGGGAGGLGIVFAAAGAGAQSSPAS